MSALAVSCLVRPSSLNHFLGKSWSVGGVQNGTEIIFADRQIRTRLYISCPARPLSQLGLLLRSAKDKEEQLLVDCERGFNLPCRQ